MKGLPLEYVTKMGEEGSCKLGVLSDSIISEIYITDAVVVRCPVDQTRRLRSDSIFNLLMGFGLRGRVVITGTNDMVGRDETIKDPPGKSQRNGTTGEKVLKRWGKNRHGIVKRREKRRNK